MRLLNWLLHLVIVAILCCGFDLHAQTQGNLPNVKDSAIDGIIGGSGNGVIAWPEAIALNDTVVLCIDTDQPAGPFPIADTLANSWTCTTPTQTPAPASNGYVNMCYMKSTSAGADTVTYSIPGASGHMVGGRFSGLGVVDGSVATGTLAGSGSGGQSTVSTTQTTSVNNAVAISCGGVSGANSGQLMAPSTGEPIAHEPLGYPTLSIIRTGTKGSQTATYNTWNGACGFGCTPTSFALQTLAFKTSTNIALADTALPDAAAGVAYSAQLHGFGGTAGFTYACTGLPANGLSLNTATGVISGATPTLGSLSLGCTVTDGTLTSATDTLPLTIGGGFGTPFIRSYSTNFNGFTGTVTGAVCGDMIHVLARGNDTHSDSGFVGAVSGSANKISDSFGSPVQRMLLPIAGVPHSPIIDYAIGPLTQSGTDAITIANNQSANSGLPVSAIFDVANVQSVSDQGAFGENILLNGTVSAAFTSVVPNTLLLTGATVLENFIGTIAISLGAPFTANSIDSDIFGYSVFGNALIAAAGTTTATYTVSGASGLAEYGAVVVPLRPALPVASCNVFTGTGEKIRRQAF